MQGRIKKEEKNKKPHLMYTTKQRAAATGQDTQSQNERLQ